jgi:hypothetical protein
MTTPMTMIKDKLTQASRGDDGPTEFLQCWVTLTPMLVEELLALGGNFRKPDRARVDMYLEEMQRGEWAWQLWPMAMVSRSGHLIDNNQRLLAYRRYLANGGTPQFVEIRYEVPDNWAYLLDAQRPRTTQQRADHAGVKDTGSVSTIFTTLYKLARGGNYPMSPSALTSAVGFDTSTATPLRDVLEEASRMYKRVYARLGKDARGAITYSGLGTALALCLSQDNEAHDRTWGILNPMIEGAEFAPTKLGIGGTAVINVMRSSAHLGSGGTYGRMLRQHIAVKTAFDDPTVTYKTFERRMLSSDPIRANEKTLAEYAKYASQLQELAKMMLKDVM